jgi:hypothetical protein
MGYIRPEIQTGSVTNFAGGVGTGLLQTLLDFVTSDPYTPGLDWQVAMNNPSTDDDQYTISYDTGYREVILSNVGVSGNESIFIGIREYKYPAGNEYNWELNGYLSEPAGWNSHALGTHQLDGWDDTRKHWTQLPMLQCFDQEMEYWFYSTQEFIQVAIRVGTNYYQCYLGNGQRLGSPSEYPNPLVVAGSSVGNRSYQSGGWGPARPIPWGTNNTTQADAVGEFTLFFVDANGTFITLPYVDPMQGNSEARSCTDTDAGAAWMCPIFYRTSDQTYLQLYNMFVIRTNNMLSEVTYEDTNNRTFRAFAQGQTDYDYDFLSILEIIGSTTTTT